MKVVAIAAVSFWVGLSGPLAISDAIAGPEEIERWMNERNIGDAYGSNSSDVYVTGVYSNRIDTYDINSRFAGCDIYADWTHLRSRTIAIHQRPGHVFEDKTLNDRREYTVRSEQGRELALTVITPFIGIVT